MSRRSGVTLVEVLVAIFVMGIGLIALLTLFPIGMLRMARAIHYERSVQSARNADANAIIHGIRQDIDVVTDIRVGGDPYNALNPNWDVFRNPCPILPRNAFPAPVPGLLNADPYHDSYAIFVDPIGFNNLPTGASQDWVGGFEPTRNAPPFASNVGSPPLNYKGGLRRRPVEFVRRGAPPIATRNLRILTAFTLWDDMVFEANTGNASLPGTPQSVAGIVLRDPRFSWGYTMRRPMTSDRSIVDCSIVVFDKRSLSITGAGSLSEHVYPNLTYFNHLNNTITIDITAAATVPPPVRAGDWIMDVTPYNPTPTSGAAHAYWYRIVAAEEIVNNGRRFARFEVQQPIRGVNQFPGTFQTWAGTPAMALGFQGTSVILEGVAEVFDKGPGRLP